MQLQKIGENNEYKFYGPGGKGISRFGISKKLNPPDIIKVPTTIEKANVVYDKLGQVLDINPSPDHNIILLEGRYFGYPKAIIGVCYPTCALPFIDYDKKKLHIINYCDRQIPAFTFALNDYSYDINFKKFIKTETPAKVLSGWRDKKTTSLIPVTQNGYTFKGEIDNYGRALIVYASPKQLSLTPQFQEAFQKFLETNGLTLKQEGTEAVIYDTAYKNEYKAVSPHLNLIEMLAKYGMVLFPCENLPAGVF